DFVWSGSGLAAFGKIGVIPTKRLWFDPLGFARSARVFDNDTHAMASVIVCEITQNPHAWMFPLDNSRNPLRRAYPQDRNTRRIRDRVSIEGGNFEKVPGQGETPNFGGAAIQYVKENALTLFNSNRFSMPKHPAIDGKELVTNFISVRHAFGERSFH